MQRQFAYSEFPDILTSNVTCFLFYEDMWRLFNPTTCFLTMNIQDLPDYFQKAKSYTLKLNDVCETVYVKEHCNPCDLPNVMLKYINPKVMYIAEFLGTHICLKANEMDERSKEHVLISLTVKMPEMSKVKYGSFYVFCYLKMYAIFELM